MTFRLIHFTYQQTLQKQVDWQAGNITINLSAPAPTIPPGTIFISPLAPPQPRPIDFIFPNVTLILPFAGAPRSAILIVPGPPVLRSFDFTFPNLVLPTKFIPYTLPRAAHFTYQNPPAKPVDLPPPNLTIFIPTINVPRGVMHIGPPPPRRQQLFDFQFPNLVLTAPAVQKPVVTQTFDHVTPAPRQLDFQFPNLVATASFVTLPQVQTSVQTIPARQPPPQDIIPPNLVVATPPTVPIRPPVAGIDRPVATFIPTDGPIPNILITTLSIKPVVNQTFDHPPIPPRQLDFQFPNLVIIPPPLVPARALWLDRGPIATSIRVDAPIPNLLTTTLAVVTVQNPFTNFIFERPPAPSAPQDQQPSNLLTTTLAPVVQQPIANFIFERGPVATSIPVDAPVPNLLTTTLAVVQQPISNANLLFALRPASSPPPQDQAPVNLLPTLLQTVPGTPVQVKQYYSLISDRPSPQAPPWDPIPPNNTILLPPPIPPVGLHQNPVFISMGKLMYLGNLPS